MALAMRGLQGELSAVSRRLTLVERAVDPSLLAEIEAQLERAAAERPDLGVGPVREAHSTHASVDRPGATPVEVVRPATGAEPVASEVTVPASQPEPLDRTPEPTVPSSPARTEVSRVTWVGADEIDELVNGANALMLEEESTTVTDEELAALRERAERAEAELANMRSLLDEH